MRSVSILFYSIFMLGLVTLSSCSGSDTESSSKEETTTAAPEATKTPPATEQPTATAFDEFVPTDAGDPKEIEAIKEVIDDIYGEGMPYYRMSDLSQDLFAPALRDLLGDVKETEEWSAKKAAADEKPAMIEGAVFSSLYEGYSSYAIKGVLIENYEAQVTIEFTFTLDEISETWEDIIVMEKNTFWQLKNVVYNPEIHQGEPDMRKVLYKFTEDNV